MTPFGANTWIWVSPLTDERLARLAPRIREFGFDFMELPIENLGDWDPGRARELLDELGRLMRDLGVNASGAALAVELLEAQRELERRIRRLERLVGDY